MVSSSAWVLVLVCIGGPCVGAESIHADFSSQTFDQWLFRTDSRESGGRWDLEGGALRAILPLGKVGRPPLRFFGQFRLEGNFEIVASFEIKKLPRPAQPPGNNSIELAIWGPGRYASVFRQAQATADGRGFFVHSDDAHRDIAEFVPAAETSGRLGFRRVGDRVSFLYGKSSSPLAEIGSAPLGAGPIDGLVLMGFANSTPDGLDVQFDRIEVVADRIKRSFGPPTSAWKTWSAAAVGVMLFVAVYLAVRRGRSMSR